MSEREQKYAEAIRTPGDGRVYAVMAVADAELAEARAEIERLSESLLRHIGGVASWQARAEAAEAERDELRRQVAALVDEWSNAADHGEDERHGRIIARTLRGCAEQVHELLGGCCTACKGTGYSYEGLCWDCRGTGHPHPSSSDATEAKP